MRYVLSFGSANAGASPAFGHFKNADTLVAVTPPTIVEDEDGDYYFDWDWTLTTVSSIKYMASVGGVELTGVINSTDVDQAAGVGAAGATASQPWLWTAGAIINQAAVECGLDEVVDPYASTLSHFKQLRALLKTCGMELVGARDWKVLVKEASFTGDGTSTLFSLPGDFARFVDQSGWNRSSGEPLGNPLSSAGWQYLKAWTSTATIRVYWRHVAGQVQFYTAIPNTEVVYSDYVSRYWVASSGSSVADSLAPAASGDVVMLDPLLVTKFLKFKYLDMKGLPQAASAQEEYRSALEGAAGNEPAPVLSLGGGRDPFRFVDSLNAPDTGYGT